MGSRDWYSSGEKEMEEYEMLIRERQRLLNNQAREGEDAPIRRTRVHRERRRDHGQQQLMFDYLSPNPTYDELQFRQRFRMRPILFNRIVGEMATFDPTNFAQRPDALNRMSFSPEVKVSCALRMLAYGCSGDSLDEYFRIGITTSLNNLRKFCDTVVNMYGTTYLREPTTADMRILLAKAEERGFPGMLGSNDWEWRNCPTAWAGQFTGHHGKPSIILEAVASYDTWIWHAFFGTPRSNNDLNVLAISPVFNWVLNGHAPKASFMVNNKSYSQCYYLADGIYPTWAIFVKTFANLSNVKESEFKRFQESYRKDVERAFGILQARFAIVRGPGRAWYMVKLKKIMLACIILHNMIIENERGTDYERFKNFPYERTTFVEEIQVERDTPTLMDYLASNQRVRDVGSHRSLRKDLVNHLWSHIGNE